MLEVDLYQIYQTSRNSSAQIQRILELKEKEREYTEMEENEQNVGDCCVVKISDIFIIKTRKDETNQDKSNTRKIKEKTSRG